MVMATATAVRSGQKTNWNQIRLEWSNQVHDLVQEVRSWSEEQGWRVTEAQVELNEAGLGTYTLPMLTIDLPEGTAILKPVAQRVLNGQGRVDLYSYPTMDKVMLFCKGGTWVVRPELGPSWPLAWGKVCFLDLMQRLVIEP